MAFCPLPCFRRSYLYNISEEDRKKHLTIEKQLREDACRIRSDKRLRVLLLGTGESGKTTFIKQIKIIYGSGFTVDERLEFRSHIYLNVIRGLKVLVDAMRKLKIGYTEELNSQYVDIVLGFTDYPDPSSFRDFASIVKRLWADPAVKRVADYGGKQFQFTESVKIFFDNIERISGLVSIYFLHNLMINLFHHRNTCQSMMILCWLENQQKTFRSTLV